MGTLLQFDFEATEDELKTLFGVAGKVKSVSLLLDADKKSRGMGVVGR